MTDGKNLEKGAPARVGEGHEEVEDWSFDGSVEGNLVQLRYLTEEGHLHALRAADVAKVIQGVVELASEMDKAGAFGAVPVDLHIRPVAEGSFIIEIFNIVVPFLQDNAVPIGTGMAIGQGANTVGSKLAATIKWGMRAVRTKVTDVEPYDEDRKLLKFEDGDIKVVANEVAEVFMERRVKTKQALRKIGLPMSDEADRMEIRDGSSDQSTEEIKDTPADFVVQSREYEDVATPDDTLEVEDHDTFTTTARIRSLDFDNMDKWRMKTPEGDWKVTIADPEFRKKLSQGWAIRPDDLYEVEIRDDITKKAEAQRVKHDRQAISIRLLKRGVEDDGDET